MISIATIMMTKGIESFIGDYLKAFAIPLIMVGTIILIFGPIILKDFHVNLAKRLISNSLAFLLLLTGLDYFLAQHMGKFGVGYIMLALIILNYSGKQQSQSNSII